MAACYISSIKYQLHAYFNILLRQIRFSHPICPPHWRGTWHCHLREGGEVEGRRDVRCMWERPAHCPSSKTIYIIDQAGFCMPNHLTASAGRRGCREAVRQAGGLRTEPGRQHHRPFHTAGTQHRHKHTLLFALTCTSMYMFCILKVAVKWEITYHLLIIQEQ